MSDRMSGRLREHLGLGFDQAGEQDLVDSVHYDNQQFLAMDDVQCDPCDCGLIA